MATIEERASEVALRKFPQFNKFEQLACEKGYIEGAKEQEEICNAKTKEIRKNFEGAKLLIENLTSENIRLQQEIEDMRGKTSKIFNSWLGKFSYTSHFYNCFDGCCPFCEYVTDDNHPYHYRCKKLNKVIKELSYQESMNKDFRNSETKVLDSCPFLENNNMADDE